jgi:hypothetical protein
MIVEQAVTNDVLDMGLLQQTAEPARQILDVKTIDVVADKGYFKSEDIEACEKAGLTPHVPKPQRGSAVANGFFRKDEFRYDAARDAYVCPGGHELKPVRQGRLRDMRKVDYANASACRNSRSLNRAMPTLLSRGSDDRCPRQGIPDFQGSARALALLSSEASRYG